MLFFFSSRRRHTRFDCDWSSDVCSSDLLANFDVVRTATEQSVKYSPNCILVVVTNPLDAMCQAALMVSKFSKNRVVGMAGVLDSARFRTFIAQEPKVSVENVTAVGMGGHGDTRVPLERLSNVSGC